MHCKPQANSTATRESHLKSYNFIQTLTQVVSRYIVSDRANDPSAGSPTETLLRLLLPLTWRGQVLDAWLDLPLAAAPLSSFFLSFFFFSCPSSFFFFHLLFFLLSFFLLWATNKKKDKIKNDLSLATFTKNKKKYTLQDCWSTSLRNLRPYFHKGWYTQ